MKKLVTISLFIFWAVVTALLIAALLYNQKQNSGSEPNQPAADNRATTTQPAVQLAPSTVPVPAAKTSAKTTPKPAPTPAPIPKPTPTPTPPPSNTVTLTAQMISRHNTAVDCWMIISGKAYDLTAYIKLHPGGEDKILRGCGQDGTSLYANKGGEGAPHSSYAVSLLADYYIGTLGQQIAPR